MIVVPAMILLFGYSDLLARGTSLLMMLPTAVSGTIGNVKWRNVDLRAGALIGVSACVTVALGTFTASAIPPQVANLLFVAFLVFLILKTLQEALKNRRRRA